MRADAGATGKARARIYTWVWGGMFRTIAIGLCLSLAACAGFPEVAKLEGASGPPPALLPLDGLLPEAVPTADPALALAARAASLQARAAAIGTP